MAVCLVTGGAGFIGSHLVEALLALGHEVRVLDNFTTGSFDNLSRVQRDVVLIPGDVANGPVVRGATEGAELVFHLAQPAAFGATAPAKDIGALQVLRCAQAASVRRIIYASTFRVGSTQLARSPYAAAKLAGEELCAAFTNDFGLETVRLRYFHVFGPREPNQDLDWQGIKPLLHAVFTDHRPLIKGTGGETQDLIYVDDVVHATLLAAEGSRVAGHVYDIGRGRTLTMQEILAAIDAIANVEMQATYVSDGPADPPVQADISRAEIELGFSPSVDLEEGLRRCLEHYVTLTEEFKAPKDPPWPGGPESGENQRGF